MWLCIIESHPSISNAMVLLLVILTANICIKKPVIIADGYSYSFPFNILASVLNWAAMVWRWRWWYSMHKSITKKFFSGLFSFPRHESFHLSKNKLAYSWQTRLDERVEGGYVLCYIFSTFPQDLLSTSLYYSYYNTWLSLEKNMACPSVQRFVKQEADNTNI